MKIHQYGTRTISIVFDFLRIGGAAVGNILEIR